MRKDLSIFNSRQIKSGDALPQRAEQICAGGVGDFRDIRNGLRGAAVGAVNRGDISDAG